MPDNQTPSKYGRATKLGVSVNASPRRPILKMSNQANLIVRKYIAPLLLAAATLPALANDFYVVVPVKGKTSGKVPTADIRVTLNSVSMPDARTATAYSYDLKQNLMVTGDASYTGQGVTWSVTDGALPAGLALDSASGVLSGTPSQGGTASFTVTAAYKTKSGLQAYQLIVAQGLNRLTNAGKTFVLSGPNIVDLAGATAACAKVIDGESGWRLPALQELGELHVATGNTAAPFAQAGWPTGAEDWYWTTTLYRTGVWQVWRPYSNQSSVCGPADVCARAICVK